MHLRKVNGRHCIHWEQELQVRAASLLDRTVEPAGVLQVLGGTLAMPAASPFIPSLPLRLCLYLVVIAQSSQDWLTSETVCEQLWGLIRRYSSKCKLFWEWGAWKSLSLDHEGSAMWQAPKLLCTLWVPSLFFGEWFFLILVVLSREYLMGLSYCPCNFLSFFKKIFIFGCAGSSLLHGLFSSCRDRGLLSSWRVWVPSLAADHGL